MEERKPCKECREQISVEVNRCPHCGHIGVEDRTIGLGIILIGPGIFLTALSSVPSSGYR